MNRVLTTNVHPFKQFASKVGRRAPGADRGHVDLTRPGKPYDGLMMNGRHSSITRLKEPCWSISTSKCFGAKSHAVQ